MQSDFFVLVQLPNRTGSILVQSLRAIGVGEQGILYLDLIECSRTLANTYVKKPRVLFQVVYVLYVFQNENG